VARVGNLDGEDPRLSGIERKFDIRVVDLSKFKGEDLSNHSKFLTALPQSKAIYAAHAGSAGEDSFNKGGVLVYDATSGVLQLPDTLGRALSGAQ